MSIILKFPVSAAKAFGTKLQTVLTELELQQNLINTALTNLYEKWQGTGKESFQQSAEENRAAIGKCIDTLQMAQEFFSGEVWQGLQTLQLAANGIGAPFGAAGGAVDGTVLLTTDGDAISDESDIIRAKYVEIDDALNSAKTLIDEITTTEKLIEAQTIVTDNTLHFARFVELFEKYSQEVTDFCSLLNRSCSQYEVPDGYRDMSYNQMYIAALPKGLFLSMLDPANLPEELRAYWVERMYQMCMEDENLWKEMLGKAADQISDPEYEVLAMVYTSLPAEKLAEFLQGCAVCVSDVTEQSSSQWMWEPDQNKLAIIQGFVQKQYAANLESLREYNLDTHDPANVYEFEKKEEALLQILQRKVLLTEFAQIDSFRSTEDGLPDLLITAGEKGDLTLSYGMYYTTSLFYNRGEVSISKPVNGSSIGSEQFNRFMKELNDRLSWSWGSLIPSTVEELSGFAAEKSLQTALSKILNVTLEGVGGVILGFIGSIATSTGFDALEAKDNLEYNFQNTILQYVVNSLGRSDCNAVFVTREPGNSGHIYAEEGRNTQVIVDAIKELREIYGDNIPQEAYDDAFRATIESAQKRE